MDRGRLMAIFEIPYPSTSIIEGPELWESVDAVLPGMTFIFPPEPDCSIRIRFERMRAYRFRSDSHCTTWHMGAYDKLCEVQSSDWIHELKSDSRPPWDEHWIMRHFVIYFDGAGCFEVVAESAEMEQVE